MARSPASMPIITTLGVGNSGGAPDETTVKILEAITSSKGETTLPQPLKYVGSSRHLNLPRWVLP